MLPYKLTVKEQTPYGATHTNNMCQGMKALLVAVICFHDLNYTQVLGGGQALKTMFHIFYLP